MTEFIAQISTEVVELLRDTVDEMTAMFGISKAEAVARINAQWEGQEFLERSDIILHEDSYYWSLFIYYDGDVPNWNPGADRSSWSVKSAPPRGSEFWTIPEV
ncbi:hypothetical protein [Streptomyces sp. NBC_01190]|uniref:hypothetical protein n=1 Tax=Streptomyces sp. NBC_01190 TaxID=2903767 RepID=UPI0038657FE8|nr:hypothetical protein OG519_24505 [Streptomyces sp. NBC_01190]